MTELDLLRALLLFSLAVAPLATHYRDPTAPSRARTATHLGALACAAIGLFTVATWASSLWLAFCAASFAGFLRATWRRDGWSALRAPPHLAACVPFVFSVIAAVWLVGGTNDLRVLGYGAEFSFYAALHGNVLGWTLVGAFAALAGRDGPRRAVFLVSVFACFASFLLIALGIDRLAALKPLGVVGLSLAIPAAQLAFLSRTFAANRRAFALGCLSLAGVVATMTLAWMNELAPPVFTALGVRGMVSVHGALNALVVAPSMLAAAAIERRAREGSARRGESR